MNTQTSTHTYEHTNKKKNTHTSGVDSSGTFVDETFIVAPHTPHHTHRLLHMQVHSYIHTHVHTCTAYIHTHTYTHYTV